MKRARLVFYLLALIGIGGVLKGEVSFSNNAPSQPAPKAFPQAHASFKMSGVIKALERTDPDHFRLIVVGASGMERTVLISPNTPVMFQEPSSEKSPIPINDLKAGDVVDIDLGRDQETQELLVQRLSVVARAASEPAPREKALLKDPEFE